MSNRNKSKEKDMRPMTVTQVVKDFQKAMEPIYHLLITERAAEPVLEIDCDALRASLADRDKRIAGDEMGPDDVTMCVDEEFISALERIQDALAVVVDTDLGFSG